MYSTHETTAPKFGAKLQSEQYYQAVTNIVQVLRSKTSLRLIADYLNRAQLSTPSGLIWTRARVSDYIKSTAYKGT